MPAPWLLQHGVVAGSCGRGKTTTALRVASEASRLGFKVIVLDGKASETTEKQLEALTDLRQRRFLSARSSSLDGWQGDPDAILNRLIATESYSEPFYQAVAQSTLRLALHAPGAPPLTSFDELISRLDKRWLTGVWRGDDSAMAILRRIESRHLTGLLLRYDGVRAALAGAVDGKSRYDDADVIYVPFGSPGNTLQARATAAWLLEDLVHYATVRKESGEKVLVMIDEFSRVAAWAPAALELVERVRERAVGVWTIVQDTTGLGPDADSRSRILGAVRQVIAHQLHDPEVISNLAGTMTEEEMTQQHQDGAATGLDSVRTVERYRASPQEIRQLGLGEIFYLGDGRAIRALINPPEVKNAVTLVDRLASTPS